MNESGLFLAVGGILALSIAIALIASRIRVPSLVAFLLLGMLLGSESLGIVHFDNEEAARLIGTVGLAAILFEGGLSTSWRRLRQAAVPAILLSTIGVVVTAALTAGAAHTFLDLPWLHSLLLGAVVSSTDAAAVFATFRFTSIKRRIARTLEAESGINDPAAIALTIGFIEWIKQPAYGLNGVATLVIQELGLGLVVGILLGGLGMLIFSRLPRSIGSFAPVASIAAAALSFGIADYIGGSGFLAIYLVGLALGSTPSRYRGQLTVFHEGLAFVAQVSMFIMLGLFVVPSDLMAVAGPGILLALLLVLIIRPLAVFLSIYRTGFNTREKLLLGYAGLRGAVPIVLGTFVLSAHISYGETIFNVVFFIVLASALLQGTTLDWIAARLGLVDILPSIGHEDARGDRPEKIKFYVTGRHAIAGVKVYEIGLPHWAKVSVILRNSKKINPQNDTVIKAGDELLVIAPVNKHPELEDVFTRWRRRI
jgi:potassium/hydrogen antiporter